MGCLEQTDYPSSWWLWVLILVWVHEKQREQLEPKLLDYSVEAFKLGQADRPRFKLVYFELEESCHYLGISNEMVSRKVRMK